MIKAIMAVDEVGGVAKDNTLPWPKNQKDLEWFRDQTIGHVVVMGSTTWLDDFMPSPLRKRDNVVVTSDPDSCPGADDYISGDITAGLKRVEQEHSGQITWVIGGVNVMMQAINSIEVLCLSRIPGRHDCDTFLDIDTITKHFYLDHVESHPEVTFEMWKRH